MCKAPITLVREYRDVKGNLTTQVPCGKCLQCLWRRQAGWIFRIQEEQKVSTSSCFLTLTYKDAPLSFNGLPTLVKKDWQDFMKRLRKRVNRDWKLARQPGKPPKLKYYAIGEYGGNYHRPHYHAILFNLPMFYITSGSQIEQTWDRGIIDIGSVRPGSIAYVTKYVMKGTWQPFGELDDREKPWSVNSNGLGAAYMTDEKVSWHQDNLVGCLVKPGGELQAMPRYYKDKIFNKLQKAQILEEYKKLNEISWEDFVNIDFKARMLCQERKEQLYNRKLRQEYSLMDSVASLTQATRDLLVHLEEAQN